MEKILFDLPDALLTDSSIWDLSNKKKLKLNFETAVKRFKQCATSTWSDLMQDWIYVSQARKYDLEYTRRF